MTSLLVSVASNPVSHAVHLDGGRYDCNVEEHAMRLKSLQEAGEREEDLETNRRMNDGDG